MMAPHVLAAQIGRDPEMSAILAELRGMSSAEFDRAVLEWALDPSASEDALFDHPMIVGRTARALERLVAPGAKGGDLIALRDLADKVRRHALNHGAVAPQRERPAAEPRAQASGRPPARKRPPKVGIVTVRPAGIAEVRLPGQEDLTPSSRARLEKMVYALKHDEGSWEDAVYLWATSNLGHQEDLIFQSTELAKVTGDTLRRLQRTVAQRRDATEDATEKALLWRDHRLLGEARNALKPYVNLALAARARRKDEERALKVLRRVHYVAFTQIKADFGAKKPMREVEQRARQRLREMIGGTGEQTVARKRTRRKRSKRK